MEAQNSRHEIQPAGPCFLARECVGGVRHDQNAGCLEDLGDKVALLVLFDTTVLASAIVRDCARSDCRCKTS